MIIILIAIALFVLPLIFAVVGIFRRWEEELLCACGGCSLFFLLLGLVPGIWCMVVNQESFAKTEEYSIQERIKLYQNEKIVLESYHLINDNNTKTSFTSDITFETISTEHYYEMIKNYNSKVYDLKTNIMCHKNKRTNPWVNWFESAAWDHISEEELNALTYTVGK